MEKNYVSTRNDQIQATAKQAVLKGIAPDGGLFVRPDLDQVQLDLDRIINQDYMENAVYILSGLLGDYTEEELKECVKNAYENSFAAEEITPLKRLEMSMC